MIAACGRTVRPTTPRLYIQREAIVNLVVAAHRMKLSRIVPPTVFLKVMSLSHPPIPPFLALAERASRRPRERAGGVKLHTHAQSTRVRAPSSPELPIDGGAANASEFDEPWRGGARGGARGCRLLDKTEGEGDASAAHKGEGALCGRFGLLFDAGQ